MPTNLAPYIELPPLQKQEIKPYTKTEIVAFLESLRGWGYVCRIYPLDDLYRHDAG